LNGAPSALVLGDNVFYGHDFASALDRAYHQPSGATVFAYPVHDPHRYGVVEFDSNKKAISIEEKPKFPKSHFAVPGIYFYDNRVVEIAKGLKPSSRGEYEITDVNKRYLEMDELQVQLLSRGTAWLDTGTFLSLLQAGEFVHVVEERQGFKIGCIEEVAWRMKFIDDQQLENLAAAVDKSGYGEYLRGLKRYA